MKKLLSLLLGVLFFNACIRNLDISITGMTFHGSEIYEDYSVETELLDTVLIFGADFITEPGPIQAHIQNTNFLNTVIEEELVLTTNKDLFLAADTIHSGENLMPYFEYLRLHKNYYMLTYNFRNTVPFLNESGDYKFYLTAPLSDGTELEDSCLVSINF